jgi:hypothetical protein
MNQREKEVKQAGLLFCLVFLEVPRNYSGPEA